MGLRCIHIPKSSIKNVFCTIETVFTQLTFLSGLDPAGPYFSDVKEDVRLDPRDARYVDVIHTDAGVFGTSRKLGHIDFYPNGGSQQPGCVVNILSKYAANYTKSTDRIVVPMMRLRKVLLATSIS